MENDVLFYVKANLKKYSLSEETIFFDFAEQKFIFPDSIAEFVLSDLMTGSTLDSSIAAVALVYDVPVSVVTEDIQDFLRNTFQFASGKDSQTAADPCFETPENFDGALAKKATFDCAGYRVHLGFADLDDYNEWLESNWLPLVDCHQGAALDLVVARGANAYRILGAFAEPLVLATVAEAMLMLRAMAEDVVARKLSHTITFHAGAVAVAGRGLLLPAIGGSGKSTLVAALSCKGCTLYHDDIVPLDSSKKIHSVGQIVKLKSGSWPVIDPLASVARVGEPINFGSTRVKTYEFVSEHVPQPVPVQWLIMPMFKPDIAPCNEMMSVGDVLHALVEAGCLLNTPLDDADVSQLLQWLSTLECWKITYPDLDTALMMIRELIGDENAPF